jgi:GDP-4-dehydro-6-deoxy-D-mannose reductase
VSSASRPVLITGAAGFVGTHLLDRLADGSAPLVGWFRPGAEPVTPHPAVTWVSIEMLDRNAVDRALAGLDPSAVYHLAGAAHVGHSWQQTRETYEGNVLATYHLLDGLRRLGQRPRVLISGSAMVYMNQDRPITDLAPIGPKSPYATSKLAQELLGRRAWSDDGIPAIVTRSFNHIGPGQHPSFVASGVARQIALIESGQQAPVLTVGNLEPKRDLMDVRDTVRAYMAIVERGTPGQTYNVCSGRAIAIGDLVRHLTSRSRVPVAIAHDPALFRPSDAPLLVGDHARLTADTGWMPEIELDKTLDDLLEYWRTQVAAVAAGGRFGERSP